MAMSTLKCLISEKIRASGGKIPFSVYMEMALYLPELGYYMRNTSPLGREGDFITAPELSPLFGRCLGRTLSPILSSFLHPVILEFGAGTGKLAQILLETIEEVDQYWIIEVSPALRKQQEKILSKYLSKIKWLESLPEEKFEGVILANEVMDAFPVTRFCLTEDSTVLEYYVCENQDHQFGWCLDVPSDKRIVYFVQTLPIMTKPYSSEYHLNIKPWIKKLSESLRSGIILLLDYGFPRHEFYHPDRDQGTLMCHYQHRAHTDPFYLPGLQDITAHVDFTLVAEGASEAGLDVSAYTSQAAFLLGCGITEWAKNEKDIQAIKKLTLPSEMGELFKVIVLSKNYDLPILGFDLQDRRSRL